MKKLQKTLAAMLAGVMLLTACGGTTDGGDTSGGTDTTGSVGSVQLGTLATNEGEPIEGGVLKVGLASSSPFKGIFNIALYEDAFDYALMQYTMFGGFHLDEDFKIQDGGPLSLVVDPEAKTSTVTINEKYTWNDGTPVTAMDFAYYYYLIGHKDYPGVRYDDDFKNVVGMEEYHAGTTDTISGVEIVDDRTIVIHFKEVGPSQLWGAGIPPEVMPYHQIKDIEIAKLVESDAVRKNPLSAGPYYISDIVEGEKVVFKANEYYWQGVPNIPEVHIELVNPDTVVEAVKTGKYDIILQAFPADLYDQIKDFNNIQILGRPQQAYSYLGFKLGKWDSEKGEVVTDLTMKMGDVNLRKAMGHALDMQAMSDNLYNGLRGPANSLIPPVFTNFHTDNPDAILYDQEKAIKILDDAGYKDVDGDGFREKPDGTPLQINVATMAGGELGDSLALFYIQSWQDIGLNAVLTTGRPIEFNAFYDKVEADDPDIDVFLGAWSTGSNPEPSGLYGRSAQFNFSRFASEELDQILADIVSHQSFDAEFRNDAYKRFESYMIEHAPVIPIQYRTQVFVINNRIKEYDFSYPKAGEPMVTWASLQLLADQPIAHQG